MTAPLLEAKTVGDSFLVDETGGLVAPAERFTPPGDPALPTGLVHGARAQLNEGGMRWWSYPVLDGELWLLHRARGRDITMAAAVEVLPAWAMLAALFLSLQLLLRLQMARVQLRDTATHDPLTNAMNRSAFDEAAAPVIEFAHRHNTPLSVLSIDADDFKRVNDTHGHAVGDEVLIALSGRIIASLRASDLLGRYGGDEFIVLAPMTDESQLDSLAERIRSTVERSPPSERALAVTVSVGAATFGPEESLRGALRRAEAALYEAKRAGRNRVVVSTADAAHTLTDVTLRADLIHSG